jgi:hypothetical protein
MAKFLKRLSARVAREALRESAKEAKNWIVSRKLILETEEGDIEFDKGETVEMKMASSYFFEWGLDDFESEVEYILNCVESENNKNAFERLFG